MVVNQVISDGQKVKASKGSTTELTGVLLELNDVRARLSRTETKGTPFSCLGELCWYLAGRKDLEFISYYIQRYEDYADNGIIFGAYGPRLFHWKEKDLSQVDNIIRLLGTKETSRKAVIQLFDAADLEADLTSPLGDIPCTCTLQFLVRNSKVNLVTYMRSNDAFIGLPHDIFCFTMLQEIIARCLNKEVGTYKHCVGSIHIYDEDAPGVRDYLEEGFQSTLLRMPQMPLGDPRAAVKELLGAESVIRNGAYVDETTLERMDDYWADLIRLLSVFRCKKDKDAKGMKRLRDAMSSSLYFPFIDKMIAALA